MTSPTAPQIPIKKSAEAMELYQDTGEKFGEVLRQLYNKVAEGDTNHLEGRFISACNKIFGQNNAYRIIDFPFTVQQNYLGEPFNHAICISINNVVAHGRPNNTPTKTGDIVSVDCGVCIRYGDRWLNLDAAFTTRVGSKSEWVNAPQKALSNIVKQQPKDTMEIATIIRETARAQHLKQVVSMTGHGIGYMLHEAPSIHNAPGEFLPVTLFEGICFCAEPIFVNPGYDSDSSFISPTCIGTDGWEVATISGDLASHFETTFGIINGQIVDLVGVSRWRL